MKRIEDCETGFVYSYDTPKEAVEIILSIAEKDRCTPAEVLDSVKIHGELITNVEYIAKKIRGTI